jgi:hypothetical protein
MNFAIALLSFEQTHEFLKRASFVTFSRDQKYADNAVELSIDLNHLGSPGEEA